MMPEQFIYSVNGNKFIHLHCGDKKLLRAWWSRMRSIYGNSLRAHR